MPFLEGSRRALRATASFNPSSIAGLRLWLDASNLALADGASVSAWPDLSGSGITVSQGTAANQPTFRAANAVNGKKSVQFDGSNDYLITTLADTFGDFSVFVAWCPLSTAGAERIMDKSYINGFWLGRETGGAGEFGGGILESGPPYGHFLTTPNSQFSTLSFTRRSSSKEVYRNGTLVSTEVGANPAALSSDAIWISSDSGSISSHSAMHLCEVLIWNVAISAAQRQIVHRYLGSKWGVTIS